VLPIFGSKTKLKISLKIRWANDKPNISFNDVVSKVLDMGNTYLDQDFAPF